MHAWHLAIGHLRATQHPHQRVLNAPLWLTHEKVLKHLESCQAKVYKHLQKSQEASEAS